MTTFFVVSGVVLVFLIFLVVDKRKSTPPTVPFYEEPVPEEVRQELRSIGMDDPSAGGSPTSNIDNTTPPWPC